VIWAGSNDGLVWVTQDDGQSWQNVTPAGLPPGGRVQNIEPGIRSPGTAYVAIYRYLLGDFAPYLYRTDDFGKTWTRLTDGRNGIAADEPTRVIREDPERPGLLYAGTEFGIYASFDNGVRWQSLQLDLPAVPVTDIRLAHGDLVLSTQGRGFWILDNLSVLRQLPTPEAAGRTSRLYKPATAIRINSGGDKGPNPGTGPEYILPGAQIDYYVAAGRTNTPLKLAILDQTGRVVRQFSSAAQPGGSSGGGEDDGLGTYRPVYQTRLDNRPGMHRFIWDLRYSGEPEGTPALPERAERRPTSPKPGEPGESGESRLRYPAGPVAAPGSYTVQMTIGGATTRQPLTIVEDPRVLASGVTNADLQALFEHNMRVLKLLNEANLDAARLTSAMARLKKRPDAVKEKALKQIADRLITPKVRYSQPALQTHVSYLYSETNGSDQKVGRDAVERYQELRQKIDEVTADLNRVLGPMKASELRELQSAGVQGPDDDSDDDDNI
jgi:hypothetical protein